MQEIISFGFTQEIIRILHLSHTASYLLGLLDPQGGHRSCGRSVGTGATWDSRGGSWCYSWVGRVCPWGPPAECSTRWRTHSAAAPRWSPVFPGFLDVANQSFANFKRIFRQINGLILNIYAILYHSLCFSSAQYYKAFFFYLIIYISIHNVESVSPVTD